MNTESVNYNPHSIGGGDGFGGLGGGGLLGGILLASVLGRNNRGGLLGGNDGCGTDASLSADGIAAKTAMLVNQNADQNALLSAIANSNATTIAEGRATLAAICDSEKTNLQQFYAGAIQAANNTQSIKDQATAFAIVNDKRFDDLAAAGVNQTAAILAKINQTEVDSLRDRLAESHRHSASQDVNIAISNSNSQVQSQLQAQAQVQAQRDFDNVRRFDSILGSFNQLNKNTQDVINFGTMAASANQANQQTNVK